MEELRTPLYVLEYTKVDVGAQFESGIARGETGWN